jgi:hypothetical protein
MRLRVSWLGKQNKRTMTIDIIQLSIASGGYRQQEKK